MQADEESNKGEVLTLSGSGSDVHDYLEQPSATGRLVQPGTQHFHRKEVRKVA